MSHIKYVMPYRNVCHSRSLNPSHALFFSFQLHDISLALHEYIRDQRKKAHGDQGDGFDRGLDNLPQPKMSSLERLVCLHHR